jgi:hypothetical protein
MTGLAGGLVETLREIGGGVGVALVATVLASGVGAGGGGAARPTAPVGAFHDAFWVMFILSVLGAVTVLTAFPRKAGAGVQPEAPAGAVRDQALEVLVSERGAKV